jgi:NTE family protein
MSRNVALVLSSGGARGVAHIGVIEELQDAGYTITSVAGTSMGALVGGMLAKGTLPEFKEWLLTFTKMDVLKFMDLTTAHGGMIKGEKVMKALGSLVGDIKIEKLQIPFACVAADLIGRKEMVFTRGSLLQAVRASCSVPTVLLPVAYESMLLVDGGVLNPLPLDIVTRKEGDLLFAVNVNANIPYVTSVSKHVSADEENYFSKAKAMINDRWSGLIEQYVEKFRNDKQPKPADIRLFDIISDSINLAQNKVAQISIEKYKPELVIETSFKTATIFDFYKSEELIEVGRIACRKALGTIRK